MSVNKNAFNDLIEVSKRWLEQETEGQRYVIPAEYQVPENKDIFAVTPIEKKIEDKHSSLSQWLEVSQLAEIEVLLITDVQELKAKQLAERLVQAIDTRIAKAQLIAAKSIEEQNLWAELFSNTKKLRHILASEMEFYQWTHLLKNYQKTPKRQIFGVPLFLLADLNCYNQDPELKKSLWISLLNEL